MERTQVISSNIVSIGYDEATSVLEVEFKGGEVYEYFDVPFHVYQEFMGAGSYGVYHNTHIRSKYRYQRV